MNRPIQAGVKEWKQRTSIRSVPPQAMEYASVTDTLVPRLCYACHTTLTSRNSKGVQTDAFATLPVWVGSLDDKVATMRAHIEDFLID